MTILELYLMAITQAPQPDRTLTMTTKLTAYRLTHPALTIDHEMTADDLLLSGLIN